MTGPTVAVSPERRVEIARAEVAVFQRLGIHLNSEAVASVVRDASARTSDRGIRERVAELIPQAARDRADRRIGDVLTRLGVPAEYIINLEGAWERLGLSTEQRLDRLINFLQDTHTAATQGGAITEFNRYQIHLQFWQRTLDGRARQVDRDRLPQDMLSAISQLRAERDSLTATIAAVERRGPARA